MSAPGGGAGSSAEAGVGRVLAHVERAIAARVIDGSRDAAGALVEAGKAASTGQRVSVVAHALALSSARRELALLAEGGHGVVLHALATGDGPHAGADLASALALGDLPLVMLIAANPVEAVDLSLVAHRAAEDSGGLCVVVHDWAGEPGALPWISSEVCAGFLGPSRAERRAADAPPAAERLPFALASAMRDLEGRVGRKLDAFERVPATGESALALVGTGAVGRVLAQDVTRLREAGHDVVAVRVIAWRPLAVTRLVKSLYRAHAFAVLEQLPRTTSAPPLASALKAAFADALTWAPGFPGIGRIPRVASGLIAPGTPVDAAHVDALVRNLLAGELAARNFTVGHGGLVGHGPE